MKRSDVEELQAVEKNLRVMLLNLKESGAFGKRRPQVIHGPVSHVGVDVDQRYLRQVAER